ncbi:MAG TPA: 50S ribosomal protein L3 [Tepidanaerobacteraceae bacterium]|jgi:large subunit ribosomal protein L3|nr:50S ribosomal protein L3 [Tepidanaerobacteraceae bacterium]HQE05375.1 50S ribosomal protein L3 [Tepidanaerobacteraceae bacterium]
MISKAILGKKIGMTQIFSDTGESLPVTLVQAGPCIVVRKRTLENDGYSAIQVGYEDIKEKKLNKPLQGQFKKSQVPFKRYLKEFKIKDADKYNVGDEIKVDIFQPGDKVDVTGISKGKGFAGTIKRWNFRRGPMSHGSKSHRIVGSIGAAGVGKVVKGLKAAGHKGAKKVTVQNLEVVKVDPDNNLLIIKGSIPGPRKSLLYIKNTVKGRN